MGLRVPLGPFPFIPFICPSYPSYLLLLSLHLLLNKDLMSKG